MGGTAAGARWRRAILHARIVARLKGSSALRDASHVAVQALASKADGAGEPPAPTRHGQYLAKLRAGVKNMIAVSSMMREVQVKKAVEAQRADAAVQGVTTTVADQAALKALSRWQQGDSSMYTAEMVQNRMRLRMHPKVTTGLHAFWTVALASACNDEGDGYSEDEGDRGQTDEGKTGDDSDWPRARTLTFDGYAMLLRRLYRTMVEDYDPEDAAKTVVDDWRKDAKGEERLSRVDFGNALFEYAPLHGFMTSDRSARPSCPACP